MSRPTKILGLNKLRQIVFYSIILFLIELLPMKSIGQNNTGSIKGKVLFEDGMPFHNATIKLMQNNYLLHLSHSDMNGDFTFNIPEGLYSIEASFPEKKGHLVRNINVRNNKASKRVFVISEKRNKPIIIPLERNSISLQESLELTEEYEYRTHHINHE